MSVRFRSVHMFDASVRTRLPSACQKRTTRCGPPMKRDPKTTSARSSTIGWTRRGYSAGSYSGAASWMSATAAATCGSAPRPRAPLPGSRSWEDDEAVPGRKPLAGERREDVGRAVRRGVVDDEDLLRERDRHHPLEERADGVGFVVDGNDDRQEAQLRHDVGIVAIRPGRLKRSGKRGP